MKSSQGFSPHDWMDHFEEQAANLERFIKTGPEIIPSHLIVTFTSGVEQRVKSLIIAPEPEIINDPELRHSAYHKIGTLVRQAGSVLNAVTTISEAWTGTTKGCRPSQDPERREIAFITSMRAGGYCVAKLYYLGRDKSNRMQIIGVEPQDFSMHSSPLLQRVFDGFGASDQSVIG
jgi:hypothetical protein